jgi:hypothetical protein
MALSDEEIRTLCKNVTDEQRQFCAEHMDGEDFPERVLSQATREAAHAGQPVESLSVEDLWSLIHSYESVSVQ